MTTETATMTEVTDDLASFSDSFLNNKPLEAAPVAGENLQELDKSDAEPVEEPTEEVGESEGDEETVDEASDEAPKPKKRTTADRIKKLAMDRAKQAEEIAALRAQIELLAGVKKEPLTQVDTPATDVPSLVRPDPEKYQYGTLDDKYLEDLADYKAAVRLQEFQAKLEKDQQTKAEQEAATRASATLQTKAAEIEQAGAAAFEDFQETVVEAGKNGEYALTKEMFETVTELPQDVAAKVLYHLATHPEESAQVAAMQPRQQALWFGRMEAKLAAPIAPPARKATQAPPPLSSATRGASGKTGVALDTDDLAAFERAFFAKR